MLRDEGYAPPKEQRVLFFLDTTNSLPVYDISVQCQPIEEIHGCIKPTGYRHYELLGERKTISALTVSTFRGFVIEVFLWYLWMWECYDVAPLSRVDYELDYYEGEAKMLWCVGV